MTSDFPDDDHPLWLVNEQIKGLLIGDGAPEDHESVLAFLFARTGLPEGTVRRMHKAIACAESKQASQEAGVMSRNVGVSAPALPHDLYVSGDTDAPDAIKDSNGEVVLSQCRYCGKGEIELESTCYAALSTLLYSALYQHPELSRGTGDSERLGELCREISEIGRTK
jgi:hypothetical protein